MSKTFPRAGDARGLYAGGGEEIEGAAAPGVMSAACYFRRPWSGN
jgi:hypothetical protein